MNNNILAPFYSNCPISPEFVEPADESPGNFKVSVVAGPDQISALTGVCLQVYCTLNSIQT